MSVWLYGYSVATWCSLICIYCRGKEFRTDFAHIGEIRSLLPKNTNVMALTATANAKTCKVIIKSLEMRRCHVLAKNPNKLNIHYAVQLKPSDPIGIFSPFIKDIIDGRIGEKCLCFCRTYDDTTRVLLWN